MRPFRSRRAWLPAALATIVMVAGTYVLQVVSDRVYDGRSRPATAGAGAGEWFGSTFLGLFGPYADSADSLRDQVALVVFGIVAVVVGFAVCWRALRSLAPGSGSLPAFLSMWMGLLLATTLATLACWVVRDSVRLTDGSVAPAVLSHARLGVAFGAKWGWVPALLALLFWVAVRPRPDRGDIDNDIVFDPDSTRGGARAADQGEDLTRPLPQTGRSGEPHPDAPYR